MVLLKLPLWFVTCALCAKVGHDSKSCKKAECCANGKCDIHHISVILICEKGILAVKITQNLSYPEVCKMWNLEPHLLEFHTLVC